jgi:uncharacterized protein (TIGR02145 family)
MKNIFRISGLILSIFLIQSCKKDKPTLPILTTTEVLKITQTTAISGGNITSDGGAAITLRGVCWNTTNDPITANSKTTDDFGTGYFTSSITGLTTNTPYYIRAYAINSVGTAYGNEIELILWMNQPGPQVVDVDRNTYKSVKIGEQIWMAENLKTTKYRDGSTIPNVTDNNLWNYLKTDAFCWYNNDATTYKNTNGALYNWYAINNTKKLCPLDWHVPTDAEWKALTDYLGGANVAGGKMKEAGTTLWKDPNTDADNSSGFTALPTAARWSIFYPLGSFSIFWSATSKDTTIYAGTWCLDYDLADLNYIS